MAAPAQLPSARLMEQIREDLTATGSAYAEIEELPIEVEQWRALARRVARGLGRPVQTLILRDGRVIAALGDWPATPEEERVHRADLQAAVNAAALPISEDLRQQIFRTLGE
ncbi:hypothetical protein [Pseudoclavibacter sp. AY1H1]|uniref:hypothetical protein n=1 Tax=Pseudoclavibacter sp. AY1H1 TaxID=2080584 RepID=UPI000D472C2B|nr:hypothetical protein [Pseudoclavibacter sp. AY1H1]PPF32644.1 hypothetical protein C5E05_19255 [Pseudoclavibacter sp. AY1H1]